VLTVLIAGISVSAGAFVWYKIVLPFGRMLEESEELERGDWPAARTAKSTESMTASLVNLSNALEASGFVSVSPEADRKETAVPAA
jgi:hypothetical protein